MSCINGIHKSLYICSIVFALYTATCSGQLAFTDITLEAGTGGPTKKDELGGHGVMFADVDQDGLPDLYITMIFEKPMPELFFRNLGNNTFANQGVARGIADFDGGSHGGCWADLDNDGDYDLINGTTWDNPEYPNHNNILRNDGDGTFTDVTPPCMRQRREETRGVICFDADNDGDPDMILVDAKESGHLYFNDGDGKFTFVRSFAKVDGYMAGLADLDNDADLDLVFAGDKKAYLNDGSGGFSEGPAVPVTGINDPRAIAFADIDNDGDMDFAVGVKRSRNWLVRNDYTGQNNWLKIKLVSPVGQAGAFGAKVRVYASGSNDKSSLVGFREARSNYGYLGQDDPVLHFGLGRHQSVDIVVIFCDGSRVRVTAGANRIVVING